MKYSFLILLFLNSVFSQNVGVTYYVEIDEESDYFQRMNKNLSDLIQNELQVIDFYEYKLVIQDSLSFFYIKEKDSKGDNRIIKSFSIANYSGEKIKSNDTVYNYDPYLKLYSYDMPKYEWDITAETKEINGYTCYKATCIKTIINPAGEFKFPVIAWFCPTLPYSYGPLDFFGLPGLILQLKYKASTYEAKKIIFNFEEKFDKEFFKQQKKLNYKEYVDYSNEVINKMNSKFKKN